MKSQYTTALILFLVFTILCGFSFSKKKFAVLGAASLLLVTSLRPVLIWLLSFVQRNFASDYAGDRIQQLIQVLSMQTVSTQTSTTRIDYYFNTITGFFESPIWGHSLFGFNSTQLQGHSTILDVLYNGGILYLFVFFWIIIFILRKSMRPDTASLCSVATTHGSVKSDRSSQRCASLTGRLLPMQT